MLERRMLFWSAVMGCFPRNRGHSIVRGLFFLGIVGVLVFPPAAHAFKPGPSIGVNVYALTSIGQEIPFVDAFKMSSPWVLRTPGQPGPPGTPKLTQDGWVASLEGRQFAQASMFNGGDGHYPGGTYTVLYEGEGTIQFARNGVTILSSKQGEIKIDVKPWAGPGNGIVLNEMETNPANPIRNIRVILPGFEKTYLKEPFNPVFLARLAPFHALRYVGWQHTNRSDTVNWSDRRTMEFETQASATSGPPQQVMTGVALEYQIDLANTLRADPWFNIPVKASDEYIRQMALLVHQRLRPDLHPMIEFSNEIWNGFFVDAAYAQKMGVEMHLAPDPAIAKLNWYALRASQMFDIWNEVYGPDKEKIVHIIAAQQSWAHLGDVELSYNDTYKKADVLAIAAYIQPLLLRDGKNYAQVAKMTSAQVLDVMDEELRTNMKTQFAQHAAIAKKYGVGLVVYEGGPGVETSRVPPEFNKTITDLFVETNRSPRMAAMYTELLDTWFASGGGLFMHFTDVFAPGHYGNWGLLEYQDQDPGQAPKYQAVTRHRAARH
jgi:hypothetical protein